MRIPVLLCLVATCCCATFASAQINGAVRQVTTVTPQDPFATLEDQLVNRLRATSIEQRGYIKHVVKQVRTGKLSIQLVVGLERYARRRRPDLPFPFFERALKFEASRRGISLPSVQTFRTTKVAGQR